MRGTRRGRALAFGLLAACAAAPAWAESRIVDGVAAQVGSRIVLISEVDEVASPIEDRMRRAGAPRSEIMQMRADMLERLIEARLIEDVVRRLELEATDAEINAAIEGIARDTGLTLEQLAESVRAHGLTYAEYRQKIKEEVERSKVLNAMVRSRVRVEPWEVRALYAERFGNQPQGGEEVHVQHLLVTDARAQAREGRSACEVVAEARERIESEESTFADEARDLSEVNAAREGDMGWIHVDQMAPWMADALEPLEEGELSEPVQTGFGCNLLRLAERRSFTPVTFEEAEPRLLQELTARKTEEEYLRWMESLRERTYIERKGIFAEASRLEGRTSGDERPEQ